MNPELGRILLVEDDPSVLRLVSYILEKEGHSVEAAPNGLIGWEMAQRGGYDLVLTDIRMPVMDGLELLKRIKAHQPETTVLVLSAFGNKETAIEALKLGAYDYLKKPIENQRLRALVKHLVTSKRKVCPPKPSFVDAAGLLGESDVMRALFGSIERIAPYRTPVLILGEPGVGKKLVARAIHMASPWSGGPFEVFDCEATASTPLEAMLWGRPGSVEGAIPEASQGVLEMAKGGTVLLAELGYLSVQNQQRLLNSLKSSSVRLGAPKSGDRKEVRFISTTNTAIRNSVESGKFAEDLMYRLRGVVIEVPPLRARPEDIPGIVTAFASECGVEEPSQWVSDQAMERMKQYLWPYNGRELKEVVRDLSKRVGDRTVLIDDLGPRFRGASTLG